MQSIQEILPDNVKSLTSTRHSSTTNSGEISSENTAAESLANYAIKNLKQKFTGWRGAFKSQQEVDGYRKELLDAFIDKRVNSIEMIDRGLKWAARYSEENDFMPAPHKFARKCQDSEFPDPKDAYINACKQLGLHPKQRSWKHEVVEWAATETGKFDLSQNFQTVMEPKYIAIYKQICDRWTNGERPTVPEERRIEKTEAPPASKEFNIKAMAKLKAGLNHV